MEKHTENILREIIKEELLKESNNNIEVFLGGTKVDNNDWRDELISKLKIKFFNPIVKDWNEKAQELEIKKRNSCDFVLYVITPQMTGVYSIAEVVDDSNKRPEKTLFCVLEKYNKEKFEKSQIKSLDIVKSMVKDNGGKVFNDLDEISTFLNNFKKK
jgi:hypothetical protein